MFNALHFVNNKLCLHFYINMVQDYQIQIGVINELGQK